MFNCDLKKLRISFIELHAAEDIARPEYGRYCLLELKDGKFTAGAWYPDSTGENGEFSNGTSKEIPLDDVAGWQDMAVFDLTECLEKESLTQINLGTAEEGGHSFTAGDFRSLDDGDLPKNKQFCLLILKNGALAAGRWNKSGDSDGYFIYASALASYRQDKVWAWTPLSPDEIFLKEEEQEKERLKEEELNKDPKTDPVLFKYGTDIETYYAKALEKLLRKYPWATIAQMKKTNPWEIVPVHGKYVFAQTKKGYSGKIIANEWKEGSSADEFIDFLCKITEDAVKNSDPEVKFKYGLDLEVYLEKAFDNIKKDYRWADKNVLDKACRFDIRQVNGDWEFVRDYNGTGDYSVCEHSSAESFIERVEDAYKEEALRANPVTDTYAVPFNGVEIHGWHLERYEFSKLESGDYKVFVQAGDRVTGGSREFFITPYCFEADTYEEFLDRYLEIVPGGAFGLYKEDLLADEDLKRFLGY